MSIQRNAQDLFEYIAEVYSSDLPVVRDVLEYGDERWWHADLMPSQYCRLRNFGEAITEEGELQDSGGAWLSVTKSTCDPAPSLPDFLVNWVTLSSSPVKPPKARPTITKQERFDEDPRRISYYADFSKSWMAWHESHDGEAPSPEDHIRDWLDRSSDENFPPTPVERREIEERFEDNPARPESLKAYIESQWSIWADRTMAPFKANILYDELFSLHQRLSVEGDRWEILWGHLFLSWQHSPGQEIYHPLLLTPVFLDFDPQKRTITLTPSQTTRLDFECLRDLEYNYKDALISFLRKIDESEEPPNPWNNNSTRGLSATISGYLSNKAQAETNLYSDCAVREPTHSRDASLSNAPIIFVRERVRHFWIEDAKKVAAAIAQGATIPPFIQATVSDPDRHSKPQLLSEPSSPELSANKEDNELYFPLLHNEQQKEIWERLRQQFGVLVQGPPGTGKSHTISNIICDQLARGGKILATSQTENALRVLRGHIPAGIRALCVTQLGNDTESKKQLQEAVTTIGQHLAEKGSNARKSRIQKVVENLKINRQNQAHLRNQIRDWAKLDSQTLLLGQEEVSAHQAAKEVAHLKEQGEWLPDRIAPEAEPPLGNPQLMELCTLLKTISPEDRAACEKKIPSIDELPSPETIRKLISELKGANSIAEELETYRIQWSVQLFSASLDQLEQAIRAVEAALTPLAGISQEWQHAILNLIVSEEHQLRFWSSFANACNDLRQKAFRYFERIQGYRMEGLSALDKGIEWIPVLDELARVVDQGKHPGGFFANLGLSKEAKHLFKSILVDNKPLSTIERINAVSDQIEYSIHVERFETRWEQTIRTVGGPKHDGQVLMPLSDIDSRIRHSKAPIEWFQAHYKLLKDSLTALGCPTNRHVFHQDSLLTEHLHCLRGQRAVVMGKAITEELLKAKNTIIRLSRFSNCHELLTHLCRAIDGLSPSEYEDSLQELERLNIISPKAARLEELLTLLRGKAPLWSAKLETDAQVMGTEAIAKNWETAWRWQRLNQWLDRLHGRESVDELQTKAEKLRQKEKELISELVIERTWQRQIEQVKEQHYTGLAAWAAAMRNYGKGTGPYAQRFLAAAARAMVDAVKAVPVWIMPLYRVVQSFPAEAGFFDLVIVDEASQCDIRALPILFRAKQVLIVGDPEQISPANVGVKKDKIFELIRLRLSQIPHPERFIIDNSLFAITQTIPGMTRTMLTEHFRCVPEIIEFNNTLCPTYAGRLEPLRQTNPHERLMPPIVSVSVIDGFKNNSEVNEAEAEAVVDALLRCCSCEKYAGRTMGVISLLGEKQAKHISDLLAKTLDEVERSKRRIICGDAYAFQGDERDVMFLSMVVAPNAPFAALVKEDARQRFNVATSRAKDQVFLFHSIRLEDIQNENCVRHKLLNWYLNPPQAEIEANLDALRQKADSPFEVEVGTMIVRRGFKVIPQYRPFPRDSQYRIDLLVQGPKGRIAVECDGDQWHGPERWEYDQRREAQLRRAGLKFWRVNGSAFYRYKDLALSGLWPILNKHCNGEDSTV